jgi:aspartate kinase
MIVQNVSKDSITDISFTAPTEQKDAVEDMLKNIAIELKAKGYDVDENVGRVSIIGAGMKSESGVASKMFKILGENSINISMISTSPIRVSCVIDSKDINAALKALHKEFIEKE